MKAVAVFPARKQVKLISVPEPRRLKNTEVLLHMLDVGICGTDREIVAFQYGTPPKGEDHLIIGHESLALVEDVGPDVRTVRKGNLVLSMVRRPCPEPYCVPCRAGRQDFCITGEYTERGIKEIHGFMTEYVIDEEEYLHVVPERLRDIAVLGEPLTIAEKAIIQVGDVQDRLPDYVRHHAGQKGDRRHNALVLGAGPVGLLGAMVFLSRGFKTFVYSREPQGGKKSHLVASLGGTYFSAETHSLRDVAEEIGNVDVTYEAAGASRLAFDAMEFIGVNGIFVFTGVPGRKAPISVKTDLLMRNMVLKNQIVLGTVNAGSNAYEAAINDLARFAEQWPDTVRALITGRFSIDEAVDVLTGEPSGIKMVIRLSHSAGAENAEGYRAGQRAGAFAGITSASREERTPVGERREQIPSRAKGRRGKMKNAKGKRQKEKFRKRER